MNTAFIRIYGGMLAATVVTGVVFYLVLMVSISYRLHNYRIDVIRGPLIFIAEIAASKPDASRRHWVDTASRMLSADMVIRSSIDLGLTEGEKEELAEHSIAFRFHGADLARPEIIVRMPGVENQFIFLEAEYASGQRIRGFTLVTKQWLLQFPEAEWNDRLSGLREKFSFPARQVRRGALDLKGGEKERLYIRNEAVLKIVKGVDGGGGVWLGLVVLPQTGNILQLGPFPRFDKTPLKILAWIVLLALVMMGLAAYLLVRPLENRLLRLEKSVMLLRGGDLSARVAVEGGGATAQLATTLNQMADHIERLMASQKELTRAVSHELRTPVARIRFGLEMLIDENDREKRKKSLEAIDVDIEELNNLIDEILTYSRLEEAAPALDFAMIDVCKLLVQVEGETRALGTKINIECLAPGLSGEGCLAEGDLRYIHRVVQNLTGNAVRYAKSRVRLSMVVAGNRVIINVEDDGDGIAEENMERVFEPFKRLDDSRTRSSGGYGLGLSIVRKIAVWHGGEVNVFASELGGAGFRFTWPLRQGDETA